MVSKTIRKPRKGVNLINSSKWWSREVIVSTSPSQNTSLKMIRSKLKFNSEKKKNKNFPVLNLEIVI